MRDPASIYKLEHYQRRFPTWTYVFYMHTNVHPPKHTYTHACTPQTYMQKNTIPYYVLFLADALCFLYLHIELLFTLQCPAQMTPWLWFLLNFHDESSFCLLLCDLWASSLSGTYPRGSGYFLSSPTKFYYLGFKVCCHTFLLRGTCPSVSIKHILDSYNKKIKKCASKCWIVFLKLIN